MINYALTTKERVKEKLGITNNSFDSLFDRLIAGVTDYIENYCNRRFRKQTGIVEIVSVEEDNQSFFVLRNAPVSNLVVYYNSGTPSAPNWTEYPADGYELVGNGESGLVKIYGGVGKGVNVIKFVYDGGYLVDWSNEYDITKHNLPHDLAELADRLVIRWYKKRESAGKASESYEGGSVNWKETIDEEDKSILDYYKRVIFIV
jgi:hypothetical protein